MINEIIVNTHHMFPSKKTDNLHRYFLSLLELVS